MTDPVLRKLSPPERRQQVALGVRAGKSNRAIAQELGVDEGTIRRDRKFLLVSKSRERIETSAKRPGGPTSGLLPGAPEDVTSPQPDPLLVTDAVKHWVAKEGMVLNEIEDVLHGARERLDFGRRTVLFLRREGIQKN